MNAMHKPKESMSFFQKLSNYKIDSALPPHEKKYLIILNQSMILGQFAGIVIQIFMLLGYLVLISVDSARYLSLFWSGIPIVIIQILATSCFFLRPKIKNYIWLYYVYGSFNGLSILLICAFYGPKVNLEYGMIILGVVGLYVGAHFKAYRYTVIASAFGGLIAAKVWYNYFPPLFRIDHDTLLFMFQLIWNTILFLLLVGIILLAGLDSRKIETNLHVEREKSEKLLLNILPVEVVTELKDNGQTVPREYSDATILFTDFVGFTKIAESLTPKELIGELDKCFSYFDSVCKKYNLEKLKTIGDSYMCAGGLPKPNNTHRIDAALAALEIQRFMTTMKEIKHSQNLPYWELRLGMHCGPLISGVIGDSKFAYDVWGDTVNLASRMESSGTPGRINISQETYSELRFLFSCEYRGEVKAKNKGLVKMFYILRIKPKFSADAEGIVPNDAFRHVYDKIAKGAKLIKKEGGTNA